MTRRRFYAAPANFADDKKSITLSAEETRHVRDVLRLHSGDEIFVFDGAGREFQCTVETIARHTTELKVISEVEAARPESALRLTLAVAFLKGEKFDLVIQKATELGVTRIVPLETSRADVRLRSSSEADKRVTRWQRIALESAKQSGRAYVPEIAAPASVESIVTSAAANLDRPNEAGRLMFSERGGSSLREATLGFPASPVDLFAMIGPEGGWTDNEIEMARENGWQIVTLGGRTLRAETAAIVVVGLLQHRFGDLV